MAELGTGGYDNSMWCQFYHTDIKPTNIRLPLGASGVTWEYKLNTNVIDTYGGQVVQILGVSIANLVIKGNFGGPDPNWGARQRGNNGFVTLRNGEVDPNPRFGDYDWINDPAHPWTNGIVQMSEWFRRYFELTTQGGTTRKGSFERFDQTHARFIYPARGWNFFIRPKSFPNVKLANDNIMPEWTVEADFIEEYEKDRTFLKDVEKVALDRLDNLKVGVGFRRQNPFSEFISTDITNLDAANKVLDSYEDSVSQGNTEEEIDDIIKFGFSFPGSAYKRAGFNTSDFLP